MATVISCGNENLRNWSDAQICEWYENYDWYRLPLKIDGGVNRREFVEQNVLNPQVWKIAYEFLKSADLDSLALGRHELDSMGTFANVQEYTTKDSAHFEAHRKYVDIQILTIGKEYIRITPVECEKTEVTPYDEAKDIEFFDAENSTSALLDGSNMIVLFPCDGHMPCMKVVENEPVRKVVVKIPYVE